MIIHRDLKPENIIVGADGYPVLIDFGTAKVVKGRTFTSLGTAHYMAPELLQG
jgi:serine/threonine protein kinase